MSIETYDPYGITDAFCEVLARIERIGTCRRLVFATTDSSIPGGPSRAVVVKLVMPAEAMAELAQMAAADNPEPERGFARVMLSAVPN